MTSLFCRISLLICNNTLVYGQMARSMVILGWMYQQHFCFRQWGKSKVGNIASAGSMTSKCQNITVLMTRKAIYFGHQPNNMNRESGLPLSQSWKQKWRKPSQYDVLFRYHYSDQLTTPFAFPHIPSLLFLDCLNPERWRKEGPLNMLKNCLPVCVLSCHSRLEPHQHHCKNLKTFQMTPVYNTAITAQLM